jgi:hypothetical protein
MNLLYIPSLLVLLTSPRSMNLRCGVEVRVVQNVWPVRVLQSTLLVFYFTSGWSKVVYGDWLTNARVLFSQVQGPFRTELAGRLLGILPLEAWTGIQVAAVAFELLAPLLFCFRLIRPVGLLYGVAFHLGIALLMHKLIYFSLQMLSFYALFLDASMLRKIPPRIRRAVGVS